ncbi:MAG: extracellular solute-binding protein [Ignavibacteriae bacterium]|nr:extracellular solute-binding protein [Ignavibacteriota bacterium]
MKRYCFVAGLMLFVLTMTFAQQQVTLRLMDWASVDEMPSDELSLAEFKKRYPHINVLYEPSPGRVYEEKILTSLVADEPPDVFLLDSKLIPTFTNKHVLLDLHPYLSKLHIDSSQWFPNVLSIARKGNSLYAFPKGFTPIMVYYNKQLFRTSNISYPTSDWTWNDYLETAKQLTKDTDNDGTVDQYGTAFTNYYYQWIPWIWSAGGDVVDATGFHATGFLNSERTESAIQFLIDLRNKHKVSPDLGTWVQSEKTGTSYALFSNGKLAMLTSGHWLMPKFVKYIQDGTLDIGVAPLPRHPDANKVNVMYESGWCVPVNTKYPEEAVLLASFMAGEITARVRSSQRLEIPAVISVAEENVKTDATGLEQVFFDEVQYCRQPWGSLIERFSEIEWTLQDAVDEVMVNGKPLHETMTKYSARVDKELAEIRSHEATEFKPMKEQSEILWFLLMVSGFWLVVSVLLYLKTKNNKRKTLRTAYSFLAPSILHLIVFMFTPIAFSAYLSMHRWDVVVPDKPFIGLDNFSEMLNDPLFWNAFKNTFVYSLNVPVGMLVSLAVALMLHKRLKGLGFLRTLYFLPSVSSFVAIALVWMWMYHPSFGAANFLLMSFGFEPSQWLNSEKTAMLSVMIFSIWLGLGYQMVIFLAGLQGIPEELYDAATIDGASTGQCFWKITFPLLKPTTFFILVTSLISSFQVFTSIYVMTAGGPVRSTDVIVYHIYQAAWEQLRMGYASAMSWVLFVLIMFVTWLQFRLLGKEVEY